MSQQANVREHVANHRSGLVTLNIGCGSDIFGEVRLDIRKKDTCANLVATASDLPFREEVFDFIRAWDILEHLEKPPIDMIFEIAKLLNNGGIIHIRTPSENYKQYLIEAICLPYYLLSCLKERSLANFTIGLRHFIDWKKRMLGAKETSGYGGHRWLIKWGKKLRWKNLIAHKYEIMLQRHNLVDESSFVLKRVLNNFGKRRYDVRGARAVRNQQHSFMKELCDLVRSYASPRALWRACEAFLMKNVKFSEPFLDLGCGDGIFSSTLFSRITVGLDVSRQVIKKTKKITVYDSLIIADARSLPFRSNVFASVMSNCVIEHINNCDEVLVEVKRVLRNKGVFVFTVPSEQFANLLPASKALSLLEGLKKKYIRKTQEERDHYHCYAPELWIEKLKEIGLHVETLKYYASPRTVVLWDFSNKLWNWGVGKFNFGSIVRRLPMRIKVGMLCFIYKPFVVPSENEGGGSFIVTESTRN